MKKVIKNEELQEKMQEAISLLCGTVKKTLGPKGNNVIIDHSTFNPFITNDGVTIAENIESEDVVVNTILELAKEASIKTNDNVGDGTTTTLVLLESIFNLGLIKVKEGVNPLILKKSLDNAVKEVCSKLELLSQKPNKNTYPLVASISANDEQIGKIVSEVYNKIKVKDAIFLKESEQEDTIIHYNKGYLFETILASPYFLQNKILNFINPYVLLINEEINDMEKLTDYINLILQENSSLIIIASDYTDDVINQVLSFYLDENINIILLKAPFYGINQQNFYQDMKIILNGILGKVTRIQINKENVLISFKETETIKNYIKNLNLTKKQISDEPNDLDIRIAMLTRGTAEIIIGAPTKTERREKKMRFEDALWAVEATKQGILVGSGLSLLQVSDSINNSDLGLSILKEALIKPIEQILTNAAENQEEIINTIRKSNYQKIFNVNNECFESINNTKVIDPKIIVINSLKNACSIASMLLTTSSLVVNEYKNEINKINDYNEL